MWMVLEDNVSIIIELYVKIPILLQLTKLRGKDEAIIYRDLPTDYSKTDYVANKEVEVREVNK